MDNQIAERLIEDFFLTEGEIDVEVIGENERKELIQKIAVALEKAEKQRGSEVLAAYRDHLSHIRGLVLEAEIKTGDKDTILSALDYEPEPAASDLEALLREEREKGLELGMVLPLLRRARDFCMQPVIHGGLPGNALLAEDLSNVIDGEAVMECEHKRKYLVEREITNIEKNEGPLNDTEYCSVCAQAQETK